MKKILLLAAVLGTTALSFAQGTISWQNSAATLISAGGTTTAATSGLYYYAIFMAPSTTSGGGSVPLFDDPAFQTVAAYNTNAAAAGRLTTRSSVDPGYASGTTVDFIIRGWSANAGATWAEALAFWNNGSPAADMYLGSTVIMNDFLVGGGALPVTPIMGTTPPQAPGFNMALIPAGTVPEPSSMALAGLGAASLLLFRRRK